MQRVDSSVLDNAYRGSGSRPFNPRQLLAVAMYCVLRGSTSPANWCRQAKDSKACELLARGYRPSRTAWYYFRDRCGKFIDQIHEQLVKQACEEKLIDAEQGILDGTFYAANASRHHLLNLTQISRRLATLKHTIQQTDDPTQVAPRGPKVKSRKVAPTPVGRKRQLKHLRAAKHRLLQEIQENSRRPKAYQRDETKMCLAVADIDAVKGKDKRGVVRPLYNFQAMIDGGSDLILSYGVFRQNNDAGVLGTMIDRAHRVLKGAQKPLQVVHADSGYAKVLEIRDATARGVELYAPVQTYVSGTGKSRSGDPLLASTDFAFDVGTQELVCPGGHLMRRVSRSRVPRANGREVIELRYEQSVANCAACPLADRCLQTKSKRRTIRRLEDQPLLDELTEKMKAESGRESCRVRKNVERRFGDRQKHRGGEQLSGRGIERAQTEAAIIAVAQNMLAIINLRKNKQKHMALS